MNQTVRQSVEASIREKQQSLATAQSNIAAARATVERWAETANTLANQILELKEFVCQMTFDWNSERFDREEDVPIFVFPVVPSQHPDLELIQRAYTAAGQALGVDYGDRPK